MKRLLLGLSVVVSVWILSPTPQASAWSFWSWWGGGGGDWHHYHDKGGGAVPELDPGMAGSAMVLLLGGVAYIASRRREEDLA